MRRIFIHTIESLLFLTLWGCSPNLEGSWEVIVWTNKGLPLYSATITEYGEMIVDEDVSIELTAEVHNEDASDTDDASAQVFTEVFTAERPLLEDPNNFQLDIASEGMSYSLKCEFPERRTINCTDTYWDSIGPYLFSFQRD